MAGDLTGIDLKLQRAKCHLAHLEKAINARVSPDLYRFETKRDLQFGKQIPTAHDVPVADPDWSLEIGTALSPELSSRPVEQRRS